MSFGNIISKEEMYNKLDVIIDKIKLLQDKNILIITHDDLDGLVSGYCFEKYLTSLGLIVKIHSISYDQIHNFDSYCYKINLSSYNTIIVLDKFDLQFISKFEGKNYFIIDHHESSKQNFITENMINIANYFKTDIVPSMGAYSYGYIKTKNIMFPSWFSFVAKITDGTYESNEFFIPLTEDEKNANYFMGLPRSEIIDFVNFINSFFNNQLEIKEIYSPFKECIDSGDIFYYFFAKSPDLIYLRKLLEKINKTKDKLLKKCLTKYKKYEHEKLIIFYLTEKENGARRLIQNQLEFAFNGYNLLLLVKIKDEYAISYRTNTTKFNVIFHLKPIYEKYCIFGGHPLAAGGLLKAEFKKKFLKDTLSYLKKYYEVEKNNIQE
jgi:single-stranded DNA-specific DHH superfamily exonuclease